MKKGIIAALTLCIAVTMIACSQHNSDASDVRIIGKQIDVYYKSCWLSSGQLFPGLFVEGGRSSTFACNYWTIEDNNYIHEPLWTYAYDFDSDREMYKELSDDKELISEGIYITSEISNEA